MNQRPIACLAATLLAFAISPSPIVAADAPAIKVSGEAKLGQLKASKLLVLGNSITQHGPKADIGWAGDWGMAASSADKDFAHLLASKIGKVTGQKPQLIARNIADFEREHAIYDIQAGLKRELAFEADIVVVAIGENVPALATDQAKAVYAAACDKLLAELKSHGAPALFVRSSFWADPTKDGIMKQACERAGGTFVDIGALGRDEANYARTERKIEHAGVAGHPGDKGMQAIADAIYQAIEKRSREKPRE